MLNQPHWEALKRAVWQRCRGRCERCGTRIRKGAAHLHHLTYERKGSELPEDVVYLCLPCHSAQHRGQPFVPVWVQRERAAARKARESDALPVATDPASAPDPTYRRVLDMMAARQSQRRTSGRFGR